MRPTLLVLAVFGLVAGMWAQTRDTVFLEDLTWTEVRDVLEAGTTTIIIPTGGTEQNGPHMVLGKHNYLVKHKAGEVARRLGNALVAPVMAYVPEGDVDPPTGHMRFPGTITTPPAVFEQLLEHAARSLRQHGFRDIALLGDSGGNQASQAAVADRLNREWVDTPVRVHHLTDYYPGPGDAWLVEQGEHSFESGVACAERLLSCEPRPTAIFAGNDDMAAGVLRVAQARGIKVPEELSICGYDDTPLSRQLWPALTTVRQPIQAMAHAAVEQLIAIHRPHLPGLKPHSVHENLQYELVIRESTCAPAR